MPRSLAEIRARAKAHGEELESLRWFRPAQLAARWNFCVSTIHAIPIEELRYKEFGGGVKLRRRRYREDWVLAYEEATGKSPADASIDAHHAEAVA